MQGNEDNSDSFSRWQSVSVQQLGATTNLILGLATGLVALMFTFLLDEKHPLANAVCPVMLAIILLGISILSAIACSLTRLYDFRYTAQLARGKLQRESRQEKRACVKTLGRWTWVLLWVQILSFGLGAVGCAYGVISSVPSPATQGSTQSAKNP